MTTIRIILADDHAILRAGLRALLEDSPDIQVVGDAGDGHAALELVVGHRPDVLVTDLSMPGLNGLELIARVRDSVPSTRCLVLSMYGDPSHVASALKAGADGYLVKGSDAAELPLAIREVARGARYLSPAVSPVADDGDPRDVRTVGGSDGLSPRQREILTMIAEGGSSRSIAARLGLSVKTVETHRAQLMEKLGIRDVVGLVRYALRVGLVREDP